jgi:4-hydroxy-tetrahydrodipicolinate synthase
MSRTGLAYYCGDDAVNLPWLSVGAVGYVSVIGHVVADRLRRMIDAYESGDVRTAREINTGLLPVLRAFNRVGGVIFSKAALGLCGLPVGEPRLPLPAATPEELELIRADLAEAGLEVGAR